MEQHKSEFSMTKSKLIQEFYIQSLTETTFFFNFFNIEIFIVIIINPNYHFLTRYIMSYSLSKMLYLFIFHKSQSKKLQNIQL